MDTIDFFFVVKKVTTVTPCKGIINIHISAAGITIFLIDFVRLVEIETSKSAVY